jgi:hypothetical protein
MRTRAKKGTSLLDKLLFRIKINEVTQCWEWQGGTNNIGYGMIRDDKKMRTAHRVSYEEHNDIKIPAGMCVCHQCDNPLCINPAHLFLGTRKQNTHDMIKKGRHNFWGNVMGGMLGKKQPKTECPHCNREIANNVFTRYHGDNCKLKP